MGQHIFFMMAKDGKRLTAAWWAVLIAILATIVGQAIGGIIFVMLLAGGLIPGATFDFADPQMDPSTFGSVAAGLLLAISFLPAAIITILWITLFEKRSLASFGLGNIGAGLVKFARGGLLALVVMAGIAYGLSGAGMAEMSAASVPDSWVIIGPLLVLVLGWCIQGSTEELVTRGLLFQSLGARHGLIVALIVSSLFFSIMHGMNPNTTPLFFINLVLYSLFVCYYALREASLWGVCGYHAIWNFAQGNIFGFAVSGMSLGQDKLMTVTPTGPDMITGGATGPEGGLVTTIALAVSGVVVLLLIKPDNHSKQIAEAAATKAETPGSPAVEDPGETPAHPS